MEIIKTTCFSFKIIVWSNFAFVYNSFENCHPAHEQQKLSRNGLPTPVEFGFHSRLEITKLMRINFDINQSFVVSTVGAKAYHVLLPIKRLTELR